MVRESRIVKMIHAADFHIGRPLPFLMSPEKAEIRRREIFEALASTVAFARENGVDLLLISGDLFEHRYVRLETMEKVVELFRSAPQVRVFIAPGDHDPAVPDSFYHTLDWPSNVTVFTDARPSCVPVNELGVVVHGIGWTSFEEQPDSLKEYDCRGSGADGIHILMVHGELVRSSLMPQHMPILPQDLAATGAAYVALGHIHQPTEAEAGDARVIYPGSPEPLGFGEGGDHGFYMVLLGPRGISTTFVPVARRRMLRTSLDVSACDRAEKVRNLILGLGTSAQRKRDFWEVTLTGVVDPALDLDTDGLESSLADEFFYLKIFSEMSPDYDVVSLTGRGEGVLEAEYCRAVLTRREQARSAGDLDRDALLERALYYGLDALRLKRIVHRGWRRPRFR